MTDRDLDDDQNESPEPHSKGRALVPYDAPRGGLTRAMQRGEFGPREKPRPDRAKEAQIGADFREVLSSVVIEEIPLSELRPNPRNARRHSPKQIAQIAESIKAFGWLVPPVVDESGMLLAGHGREAAGRLLGMTHIPCVRAEGLTLEQKRLFALADNRLGELSSWDEDILKLELEELSLPDLDLGFDLEVTGFDTVEQDRLLGPEPKHKTEKDGHSTHPDDALPPLRERQPAVSRLGDIWQLGKHRVICGNALDAETYDRLLRGEVATQVFTDPPYNVSVTRHVTSKAGFREFAMGVGEMSSGEFTNFLGTALGKMAATLVKGAILHVCMDWAHSEELLSAARRAGLTLKNMCIWVKPNAGMGSFYRSGHEIVVVLKAGREPHINNFGLGARGRYRTNVWRYPSVHGPRRGIHDPEEGGHPTVKPTALVMDAIKDCSRRGDIILDPFGGSGTTLIAAERVGRFARLIELDPHYVDLIVRRFQAVTGRAATLQEDGRQFEAVMAARTDEMVARKVEGEVA